MTLETTTGQMPGAAAQADDGQFDHRALLKSLSRAERQALLERSDVRGLVQLCGHWGAIVGVGTLIALQVPGWPVLLPLQGILLIFLFTALHETIHLTAFRTQMLNKAVAHVCGFLILVPANWFRYFHFAHHRYTQDPERDSELAAPKPASLREYLVQLSGLPVWWSEIKVLATNALGRNRDAFVPERGGKQVAAEARFYLALYVVLLAGSLALASDLLLWVWVVPVLLGQPFLRAYLLTEHSGCPQVANMLANSRTVFAGPLVRFITWNMPYHAEHHAFPSVPFHRLADFHRATRPHLAVTAGSHLAVHRGFLGRLREGMPL